MNYRQADALNEAIRAIGLRHRMLAIAALAPFGIHPGHKLLLLELEAEGPRTQAELATATGYEPPTITLSVRQLEAAGYVARRPSPTDRRATVVELTDAGRALLPKVKAAWRELAERTIANLPDATAAEVTDMLAGLAASLSAATAPAQDVPRYRRGPGG